MHPFRETMYKYMAKDFFNLIARSLTKMSEFRSRILFGES